MEPTQTPAERSTGRREEILTAAMRVFEHSGYAAATMDAVAEEASVSKGSLYNYFQSKHDLFIQVMLDLMGQAKFETLEVLESSRPASEKLSILLDTWSQMYRDYLDMGRLILEFWATAARDGQDGELGETFRKFWDEWRQTLRQVVVEGIEAGEFRPEVDPDVACWMYVGLLDGLLLQGVMNTGFTMDQYFTQRMRESVLAVLTGRFEAPEAAQDTCEELDRLGRGNE